MIGRRDESVVIVGAGIVGIACAHYLARAGWRVTLIDRGTCAGACSHANCGYICPSHVPPLTEPGAIAMALRSLFRPRSPFRVKPRLSPPFWRWMAQFARRCTHAQVLRAGKHLQEILDASMDEYRHLVPEESLACEWKDDGLLYVLRTPAAMEAFARSDRMLTESFGVSAARIESADLPSFDAGLRPGLAGAFHYPGDTSVRPDLLATQWVDRIRSRGVDVIENCEVRAVRKEAGRIVALETARGEMAADRYVFAMGAWSARWSRELECRIPIEPGKGYSVTIARPASSPVHPILFPECRVGVTPFDSALRLGSMMEFVGYDASIPAARIQQLRDSARPYLVASVDGEAQETWFGWRPMTWDSLPIIGPVPRLTNALLATGHNMLGLSLAPSTGRLVAELLDGSATHIDATPYSPSRF